MTIIGRQLRLLIVSHVVRRSLSSSLLADRQANGKYCLFARPKRDLLNLTKFYSSHRHLNHSLLNSTTYSSFWQRDKVKENSIGGGVSSRLVCSDQDGMAPIATAKQLIDTTVADNRIAIFSKTTCPFCKKVRTPMTVL